MRIVFLFLALTPVFVQASFDLVIVQDRIDANYIEYKRYDGNSGIYLGAFGRHGTFTSPTALSTNSSLGFMYTLSVLGIRKWNYSTGEDLGYVNNGAASMPAVTDSAGNFVGVAGTGQILKYNLNGTDEFISLPSGTVARWIVQQADGRWYVGDSANGGRILRSATTNVNSTYSVFSAATVSAENSRSIYMNFDVSLPASPHLMIHSRSSTYPVYEALNPSFTAVAQTGSFGPISFTVARDFALGHDNTAYLMGVNASGVASVEHWRGDSSYQVLSSTSNLINPQAMTTVLAPEPATCLALLPGLGLLLRRKRSVTA